MEDPDRFYRSGEKCSRFVPRSRPRHRVTLEEEPMHEWESLSHVRWDCKYHIVIVPKYRQKVLYSKLKRDLGEILRDLCRQKGVDLLEGHLMGDHVHMCLRVPYLPNTVFVQIKKANSPGGAFLTLLPPFRGLPEASRFAGGASLPRRGE